MATLNVILEGSLPHHFTVAFDVNQTSATYCGEQAGSRQHNEGFWNKIKADIFSVLGGGIVRYEIAGGSENQEVLVIGRSSQEFGAAPESMLRLFEPQLLQRYREIFPAIKYIKFDPDVSKMISSNYWNLDEVVRLLQAQLQAERI